MYVNMVLVEYQGLVWGEGLSILGEKLIQIALKSLDAMYRNPDD